MTFAEQPAKNKPVRVLYSFPHKLGASRICYIAWEQTRGTAKAGATVTVFPGAVQRQVPGVAAVRPTLAKGPFRIPYRLLGRMRACALHDYIVSRRLEKMAGQVDLVHAWPLGSLRTLRTAKRLGIPTVLERPNAHTRFAYSIVQAECQRLGVALPRNHEHAYNAEILALEEQEYQEASRILCPSDFVVKTFRDEGFASEKLLRHSYGYDPARFSPVPKLGNPADGLTMIFVGVCAVRKGLHFALEAWLASPAHKNGKFLIAGKFVAAYREKLASMLAHPSVQILGERHDIPELMRNSDLMVLPSIEEGFGLVCAEALGSGCVPLVSDACTDACEHLKNSLVHAVGDVKELTRQISLLHEDRALLARLRHSAMASSNSLTWDAAGERLLAAYRSVLK
jgi:glycosyltransferase involved in cell wall biosynthesis